MQKKYYTWTFFELVESDFHNGISFQRAGSSLGSFGRYSS